MTLQSPPPAAAGALWRDGQQHVLARRYAEARHAFEALLALQPEHLGARMLLASVVLAGGRVREAAARMREAAAGLPDDGALVARIAQALAQLGETNAARACLDHPVVARTRSGPALTALGHVCQGLGLHAQALALMERARAGGYDTPDFRYFHALQLQFNGRLAEAEAEMEACLRSGPTFGRASLSLARIRRQTAQSNHVGFLRRRLAGVAPGGEDHAALEFALYKELEDLGDLDGAWPALQRGNAVMAARLPHDDDAEARLFAAIERRFDAAFLAARAASQQGPVPIFVVGMPRSGTTLLETILGRHPQVASAGELNDLPKQLRWTADLHGHALLDEALLEALADLDFELLGRRYLAQSQWRAGDRPFYVDKLPPNFQLVGCIRRALPHAKVVHVVREPMDVCFSNYRALFGDAYAYSYDLARLAAHHRRYARLMRHWHAVAPGFVLDLRYAELVGDTEAACRRLLAFCGLPFDPRCLDPDRTSGSVATLSSAQVRQPIDARGLGAWRRYGERLQPLRERLQAPA